jgi:hypothetical protein
MLPLRSTIDADFQREWEARFRPSPLTAGQQLALLITRRSTLSSAVVDKLKRSTAKASPHDFDHLVRRGLAQRHASGRFLIVTFTGKLQADRIASALARDLKLHFFVTGGGRYSGYVACMCGWKYSHSRNEGHERSAFARRMSQHLAEVGQAKADVVAGPPPTDDPIARGSAFMLQTREAS